MIVSSDALVLHTMKYGDTSRIVTLLTRNHGKVSVIAKGARGPRGKYGAALEPLSICHAVFYLKENRELHTLSQADQIRSQSDITANPERILVGFAMLEYLNAMIHGEEEHERVYDLAVGALERIGAAEDAGERELLVFLAGLASVLGFSISADRCGTCGIPLDDAVFTGRLAFDSEHGGIACPNCARISRGRQYEAPVLRSIRDAVRDAYDDAMQRPRVAVRAETEHTDSALEAPQAESARVEDVRATYGDPQLHHARAVAQGPSPAAIVLALRILHHHLSSHGGGMRDVRSLDMLERLRMPAAPSHNH